MADYTRFQLRGDTKANWLSVNPILAKNEPAIETDTNRFKIGDGVSTYSQLSYGRNTSEYASLYNVTSLFPLPSGYYSHESAVLAIPSGERLKGLIITYETASGIWYTERFIGTNVSGWTTVSNWERLPNASDVSRLDANITTTNAHIANKSNPHEVTKSQVGLGNVDNTSDINKPISSATQTALNGKVNNTGNEAISGIKTFNSSPIIPTPTTDMQSSTKKYVDDSKTEIQSKQIIAGNGLTGGGTLSSDRTLDVVSANDGITVNADSIVLNTIDALDNISSTKPLSANKGKDLNDRLTITENNASTLTARVTELEAQRLCYGVEFTRGLDPAMTRWIGDTAYQSIHPVLAMFKVAKVKDGKVTGYFNQVNLFKMEDGTDSNIIIDGTIVTDDGSDVMLVNESPIYVLNGGTNETYERRLVSKVPFVHDGDAAIEIPAHGVCIDYSTIKDGKQRSIRDNTVAGTGGAGIGGISYLSDGLGCIKAEVSRFNYELYARAKNTDTSKNLPYCNSFWLDRDVWHTLLCIKFKTKDYHGDAYAGKALSSNDSAPTVSTWGTVTGVRVTETNATFSYYNLSSNRFSSTSGQSAANFWSLINTQRPLLKMFEAQLALSYAYANSIVPNTDFIYDGNTYQYANITGHKGLADGEMTAKLRKKVTVSFTGRDVTNSVDVTNMQIDYLLEQVIIKGRVAIWGHLYTWTSGIDAWTDNTNYHFYQTNDINKVTIDTDSAEKDPGVKYAFEDTYDKVTQIANGIGGVLRMNNNSLIIKNDGGSLHTGECAYSYRSGTATAGKKARKGVSFGGVASNKLESSRFAYAEPAPTFAKTYIAGGFRVELIK